MEIGNVAKIQLLRSPATNLVENSGIPQLSLSFHQMTTEARIMLLERKTVSTTFTMEMGSTEKRTPTENLARRVVALELEVQRVQVRPRACFMREQRGYFARDCTHFTSRA